MSATDLATAITEARAAEADTARIAEILAVVQAVQAATPAPAPHAACGCAQHGGSAGARGSVPVGAWIAGGAACACVLTGLFLAVALVAVAVAVAAPVAYLLVREIRKGK
ncbi:predicted protein [Streptomyces sp. SPB78]|uniref:hypothetical protein n=1 Tax=Streptomyces sp. (strain SPB78) TaxID=591157 RepID=UPI0001B54A1F|nr:hypothetical protein [Streptomyces sp. SPB78]EFL04301.1 predicted protein [Streptomyces sp. SPB78]